MVYAKTKGRLRDDSIISSTSLDLHLYLERTSALRTV